MQNNPNSNELCYNIRQLITSKMTELNRPDLYRAPITAFSDATDTRYQELKKIVGEWHMNPEELLTDARSVISFFVPFTKEVIEEPGLTESPSLWAETYTIINNYFDNISEAITKYLIAQGFSALAIRATHTFDPKDLKSMWSHRSAAAIAGLGAFGTNRLLITEKGSGGRFCTVLTSASLDERLNAADERCYNIKDGSCGQCIKVCPVNTLPNLDKFACWNHIKKVEAKLRSEGVATADICGKCISVCPVSYIEAD